MEDRLKEAGFVVKVEPFIDELGNGAVEKHGLTPGEKIYVCRKGRPG